ncbi:MAG: Uncharacterized protein Greene041662_155 [Candidatus Peregrinibacteria bacterium Greene0416_62]|nr:MAG: Uncharacterized protein Greene041662_155 [Candidatus Peregrinibacteria bacterium Greene0416_62]TSD00764.1 MAG: Uncharacterized protein Greene101449_27 [Candidatus Peregrinibacteria bacterium Greene1014_49]
MEVCKQCSAEFEITKDDLAFYTKVSPVFAGKRYNIPPPKLCPDCRQQRRLAWRNERHLYHRKCDLTGKQIVTMYRPESIHPVYEQSAWWGDAWDPLSYGRPIAWDRSFFDQFQELLHVVPRISLINKEHENSEYCNFSLHNRNSYLLFTSAECEDSYYTNRSWKCRNVCDCASLNDAELCYEVMDSDHCHTCTYLRSCTNNNDCHVGYDLKGCHHCIGCFGLRNASYCIGNVQRTEVEYKEEAPKLLRDIPALRTSFEKHLQSLPRKSMDSVNAVACTGNAIQHSKNARCCFEVMNVEDCAFVANATFMRDAYDVTNDDNSELVYEAVGSESNYMHVFNDICWFNKHLLYCSLCFHCEHCFLCTGLKHMKYCILNKQFTKEEYETLVPKIIESMQKNSQWGEFFPVTLSLFGYNETLANEYFPSTEKQVLSRGWKWHTERDAHQCLGPDQELSHDIRDVPDEITNRILRCSVTGRPYKIIPQELKFYRAMGLPLPKICPDQRHKDRNALRNPRKLWSRECSKCGKGMETTYNPERPEIVYCEECYLKTVY